MKEIGGMKIIGACDGDIGNYKRFDVNLFELVLVSSFLSR